MNHSFKILFVLLCSRFTSATASGTNLSALSSGPYVRQLYEKLRNEEGPSNADSAALHATNRFNICKCITGSGFFKLLRFIPLDPWKVLEYRDDSKYLRLFEEIFSANLQNSYDYSNEYRLLRVTRDDSYYISEYVIVCPLENSNNGDVFPLYVSKEYDVGPSRGLHKPGRFLFTPPSYKPILAEEPAEAALKLDTGVELYYLRLRKHIQPAQDNDSDPLCKLISPERSNLNNQHYRFCVAVYRSSYFEDEVDYRRHTPYSCHAREITFRTPEALEQTAGQLYYEHMTLCFSTYLRSRRRGNVGRYIYISRAYKSNQLFVYRRDPADQKIYLENLSFNISIVDELNSFEFVED